MMPFQLGLAFILLFPLHQVVGFSMIVATVAIIAATRASSGRLFLLNRKDALFLIYAVLASVVLIEEPGDLKFYARLVAYPWLITLVFQNITYTDRRARWYFWSLTFVAIGIAATMLFQHEPGQFNVSLDRLFSLSRNQGFYYNTDERIGPNAAATVSAAAIILVLSHIKFESRHIVLAYALLSMPTLFLLVAGGRNAWVGTVACVALFVVYRHNTRSHRAPRLVARTLVTTAIVGGVGYLTVKAIGITHGTMLASRLDGLLNPATDHNVQVRMIHWIRSVDMFQERPLGWGFNEYYARFGQTPHNELLGQLVSVGALAAAAYFLIIAYVWLHVWRLPRESQLTDRVRFICLCLLTVFTLAMITEHVSRGTMHTFAPLLWTIVGMSFGLRHQHALATKRQLLVNEDREHRPKLGARTIPTVV